MGKPVERIASLARAAYGVIAWLAFLAVALPLVALVAILPGETRRRAATRQAAWLVLSLMASRPRVDGLQHLPAAPCIVVANHASYLDGMVLTAALPPRFGFVIKREMTRVPLAPAVISGLINLRGQIVTAIELRRRFDMPERNVEHLPMNVVVRMEDGAVSLLVDEIGDVVEVNDEPFEAAPETIRGRANELVTGVYKMAERLLLVLDVERAVSVDRLTPHRPAA